MPLLPFPLDQNGSRPPTTYKLSVGKRAKVEHKFDDGIEINVESDLREYRLELFYQICTPTEYGNFDAHYEAWDAAIDGDEGFDLRERESGITYEGVIYLDYKRERSESGIERRSMTLMWWA